MDQYKLDRQQEMETGYQTSILMEKLNPYFEAMQAQLIMGIKQCPVADKDSLHIIKLQMHALDKLIFNMQSVLDTGLLAKVELEQSENEH